MRDSDLSILYQDLLESLDDFWSIADTKSFNTLAAQRNIDDLKSIREKINKIFLVELIYQLEAPKEYLTENELLCFVYCYCSNACLKRLIKLCYSENVIRVLESWSGALDEIKQGIDRCLDVLSNGQYEPLQERTFGQLLGADVRIDPDEFVNERVAAKLLKAGNLNKVLNTAGFTAWDKYAYCLRLKYDFVREEMLPYLCKQSVLGRCGYNKAQLSALVYFARDVSLLEEGVTFTQAINTVHDNTSPILRNYHFLLASLNNTIAELREELNLPAVEKGESSAALLEEFCGVSISDDKLSKLVEFLGKAWHERKMLKEEETLAVLLDRMC